MFGIDLFVALVAEFDRLDPVCWLADEPDATEGLALFDDRLALALVRWPSLLFLPISRVNGLVNYDENHYQQVIRREYKQRVLFFVFQ